MIGTGDLPIGTDRQPPGRRPRHATDPPLAVWPFDITKTIISPNRRGDPPMTINFMHLQPIVSLIAGVLILVMPRLLNYIVAGFLIVSGILGLGLLR